MKNNWNRNWNWKWKWKWNNWKSFFSYEQFFKRNFFIFNFHKKYSFALPFNSPLNSLLNSPLNFHKYKYKYKYQYNCNYNHKYICSIDIKQDTFKEVSYFDKFPLFEKKQKQLLLELAKQNISSENNNNNNINNNNINNNNNNNIENKKILKIKKIHESAKTYKSLIDDLEIYKELIIERERREKIKENEKEKEKEKEKEEEEEEEEINNKIMNDSDVRLLCQSLDNVKEVLFDEILQFYKNYINEDHHLDTDEIRMEIVPGVGGQEAKMFSKDLFKMYENYCEFQNYEFHIINKINDEIKGSRNIICYIKGPNVYENFVHESGIHRVQRIPFNCNKIQTSTSIVLIFDEKSQINKIKKKMEISKKDLIIETKRSGGPGGQSVNKNESCVKILHKPTNICVEVQKTSSQIQNKNLALELLKNKLYNFYYEKEKEEFIKNKKNQKLSGDRSEKIRTYNFLHNVVTDHILNEEFYDIDQFFKGNRLVQLIEKRKYHFYQNIVEQTLFHLLSFTKKY